jgi:acylphosphatase
MRRVHAVVTGEVQGVGFRYSARARAQELGLAGWVRNLADGSVEVEAEGETGAVERMLAWLDRGPRAARVASVVVTEAPVAHAMDFTIER